MSHCPHPEGGISPGHRQVSQFLLVSLSTQPGGCILFEAVVQARIRLLSPYLVTVVLYTVFLIIILVLDHPVLHTLPRSFLLKVLIHSFLHHVVCNACILPRRSCDSVCHHRYSPQRPRLRRAAIITFAHHNRRTRPSPPQHSDVHQPARSHPPHPQRRPQRRLSVHMETRHLLLHGRLSPHQRHLRCRNNSQKRSIQLTPSRKHLRRPIHLLGPLHPHPRPLLRLPPSYPDPAQAKSRLALLLLAGAQRASQKPTESTFAGPYTLRSIPRTTTIRYKALLAAQVSPPLKPFLGVYDLCREHRGKARLFRRELVHALLPFTLANNRAYANAVANPRSAADAGQPLRRPRHSSPPSRQQFPKDA